MFRSVDTSSAARSWTERRDPDDRRARPTPPFSRYWLRGRRRASRRASERINFYVDRYERSDWFLVVGILVLSLLDMVFTLAHLRAGGSEANPVMAWALAAGGESLFTAVKLATTFLGLFVLLVHARFRRVRALLTVTFVLYAAVFVYHLFLVHLRTSGA